MKIAEIPTPIDSSELLPKKMRPGLSTVKRRLLKGFAISGFILIVFWILGFYLSREPIVSDLANVSQLMTGEGDLSKLPTGHRTAVAVYHTGETLLNKNGGYLSNDVIPPAVFLDNMPNWEFGVITELRDAIRSLRNDFSRERTQSQEDSDLMNADAQIHFDHKRLMLPSTEREYREALRALKRYIDRLENGEATFFNRADNLNFYLSTVEKRLGSLSQRLGANVREEHFRELIYSDQSQLAEVIEPTPWSEVDDVFFEARGYVWALIHTLRGIQVDFAAILEDRGADELLERIIKKLENTQRAIISPIIQNASGFGMTTNHSLIMASYISRANAALIDLRQLLVDG